jgi:L-rhamnose mutarotase
MRVCFLLKIREEKVEEYKKHHTQVWPESCAEMKNYPVNARWQAQMTPFFEALAKGGADDNMFPLEEVFHLD